MAVIDVIDLTVSSPEVICIDDSIDAPGATRGTDPRGKKKGKERIDESRQEPRGRRRHEEGKQRCNDTWKHDKFFEDLLHQGDKRKWTDDADDSWRSRRRKRSRTPPSLFVIDTAGDSTISVPPLPLPLIDPPERSRNPNSPSAESVAEPWVVENGLLLPAHVKYNDSETPLNENPPLSPVSEASGIDFLDDDRVVGAARYFDDTSMNAKSVRSRGRCTKCGDDDHDRKSCSTMICITCGARNEHASRSCPILRFCWNCKAKGHIAKDCPAIKNVDQRQSNRQDCERCGSWKHHGTNCPTLWRIYTYLTDADRDTVLADRELKRQLAFDDGGEGYIARDHWCYNCGDSGHLGDDCEGATPNYDRPKDYSAFSSFNELTGPFSSYSPVIPEVERAPREWERGGKFDDGFGFSGENDVGRRGRENAKARAREAQRRAEENDEPDWFNLNRTASMDEKAKAKSSPQGKSGPSSKRPPPVFHLGSHTLSASDEPLDLGSGPRRPLRPSLRDRIDTNDSQILDYSRKDRQKRGRRFMPAEAADSWDGSARDRRRRRSPSRDEPWRERSSQWRGGYAR